MRPWAGPWLPSAIDEPKPSNRALPHALDAVGKPKPAAFRNLAPRQLYAGATRTDRETPLMQSTLKWTMSLVVVAATSACSFAGIAYDTITGATTTGFVTQVAAPWQAEDTLLDNPLNLALASVDLQTRLSSASTIRIFSGSLSVGVYTSVPQGSVTAPGTLLRSARVSHTWNAGVSDIISLDFSGLALPSNSLWIAWMFADANGVVQSPSTLPLFVTQTAARPAVGSTTSASSSSNASSGPWQTQIGMGSARSLRLVTVPAPGGIGVASLLVIRVARRRRRGS